MGCTCFRCAPCSYCLGTWECAICGDIQHPDEGGEIFAAVGGGTDAEYMCGKCVLDVEREALITHEEFQSFWGGLSEEQKDAAIRDVLRVA